MEFLALIFAVFLYQWIMIPVVKKKVGFMRDQSNPLFYDYKTKWHMPFELGTMIVTIALAVLCAPVFGIYSALFIPVGLIAVFVMRGKLEYKVMATFKLFPSTYSALWIVTS